MENLIKTNKCPTIWLGVDTMVQNQAHSEALIVETRPDLDGDNFNTSIEGGDSDKEIACSEGKG
ncbi:hypothetical protein [Raineya orbicola]|jgi:hypothetical protein|uniref:Uncharacterized protein n=1 Tax=Raineya orbicola TaxID=2016530 RepID=A0A2N3IIZ8_9BACT|nr:hypothetical protein [Raineya orbicola]PKQ70287.1 hypothetical protein Rain11_0666 [Raineya orbicola]